jgi:hypothetical protein
VIVPDGYVIKARFSLHSGKLLALNVIGILLVVLFFIVFTRITASTHGDFGLAQFLSRFVSPGMRAIFAVGLLFFLWVHGFVHETTHQLCYRIFGNKANLHMVLPTPTVTLSVGDVCIRNKAIIATLGPLVVLEIVGFIVWPFVTGVFLFLTIFFLSVNIGMAAGDLATFVWLLRYPSSYYFGFDGRDSVIWGSQG